MHVVHVFIVHVVHVFIVHVIHVFIMHVIHVFIMHVIHVFIVHVVHHHVIVHHHIVHHHHVVRRLNDPEDGRDGRGVHRHSGDIFNAHGDMAHIAGGQRNSDNLISSGVAQVVVEVAGEANHAVAGRTAVGRGLTRRLIHAFPNWLIAFSAQIPIVDLVGNIAADWLAHVVESDAVFIGREEAIVGLSEHGGEGQAIALVGMEDEFISAAGQGRSRTISADWHSRDAAFCIWHAHCHVVVTIMAVGENDAATYQQQQDKKET